jgi:hypothetical protein
MNVIEHNNKERTKLLGNKIVGNMTIREHIASESMAALICEMKNSNNTPEEIAELAVRMADILIEKLNVK